MNKTLSGVCKSSAIATLLLSFCIRSGIAAERIRIATGGLAASSAAVWAGLETKSFQKYGLDGEYLALESGTPAMQALLANELQIVFTTGALAITANLQGADTTIIAGGIQSGTTVRYQKAAITVS